MRPIFKDPEHQEKFDRDGFFTIQYLNAQELADCKELFERVDPKLEANFYSSIDSFDVPYRKKVDADLRVLLEAKTKAMFDRFYPIAFTYIVKRPGPGSNVVFHVDDVHVDNDYPSVNVWCPIVDTNAVNGALEVLAGSHKLPYPQRGPGFPFPYKDYLHLVKDKIQMFELKAGEAIIYHDRLIHGSGQNDSDTIRPAVITGMIPEEGRQVIYLRPPDLPKDKVELFAVDYDFWMSFDKWQRPPGYESLGVEDYVPISISNEEFLSYFEKQES